MNGDPTCHQGWRKFHTVAEQVPTSPVGLGLQFSNPKSLG